MEEWKPVIGYEWLYRISSIGRIKSLCKTREKIMKLWTASNWYKNIDLYKLWKWKTFTVHRLVALHFIEMEIGKPEVNHINGIKEDCHVDNLEWVTHKENIKHAYDIWLMRNKYLITQAE